MPDSTPLRPLAASLLALLLAAASAPAMDDGEAPPAPVPAESFPAYVAETTGDDVRVRAGPSATYRVLEQLPRGSWVVVTGTDGEFARVRVPGGVPVFVSADLVELQEDGKRAVVTRTDVLLRPTPGQEFFPLEGQKLQEGESLVVLGREEGEAGTWLQVLTPARVEAFIHGSLLREVAAEGEKGEDLARIGMERRDGYTGGREAEAAREAIRKIEEAFAKMVDEAAAALAAAPPASLPPDAGARRDHLRQVMTESGDPATRALAGSVARDYVVRERDVLVAAAKAEGRAVAADLQERLAEVEAQYRAALEEVLKAAPKPAAPGWDAVGTVRARRGGGWELVKGGVALHSIESLRYDFSELQGLRVGVRGKRIPVDGSKGFTVLRVDALEILE